MQLAIVALVLPPLIVLARTRAYTPLRIVAAGVAGVAAVGWLAARLGFANGLSDAADGLAGISITRSRPYGSRRSSQQSRAEGRLTRTRLIMRGRSPERHSLRS